jgi:hypothetical protein
MASVLSESCLSASACETKEGLFKELGELPAEDKRLVLLFTNGSFGEPLKTYLDRVKGE